MRYYFNLSTFAFALFLSCFLLFKNSQAQVIDSSFYDWVVYEIQESELDYKQCYIVSHPQNSISDHNSRQKPYIMITRFQKDRTEEISVFGGFEFKKNSDIALLIDNKEFYLASKGEMAWSKTKSGDINIIEALLNGAVLKIRSDSSLGTFAVDEYSLKGITRAYYRMKEVCK